MNFNVEVFDPCKCCSQNICENAVSLQGSITAKYEHNEACIQPLVIAPSTEVRKGVPQTLEQLSAPRGLKIVKSSRGERT